MAPHGQHRSVFERLGPRVCRGGAPDHGFGPYGRNIATAAGRSQASLRRGRWTPTPHGLRLQSPSPAPRHDVDDAGPSNEVPADVAAHAVPTEAVQQGQFSPIIFQHLMLRTIDTSNNLGISGVLPIFLTGQQLGESVCQQHKLLGYHTKLRQQSKVSQEPRPWCK